MTAKRSNRLKQVLETEVAVDLGLSAVMHEDLRTSVRCRVVFDALM